MTTKLILMLLPILLITIAITCFAVYVFIRSPAKYHVKWVLIPLAFVLPILCTFIYALSLGYAVPHKLPDKFAFISYNTVIKDKRKVGIEVWVQEKETTRLILIPYTAKNERMMQQARMGTATGSTVVFKKKPKSENNEKGAGDEVEEQYTSNIILQSEVNPKEQSVVE